MSPRTYRRLTPAGGNRRIQANTRRAGLEQDSGLRRVDAPVAPHAIALRARANAVLLVFLLGWAVILGRAGWLAVGPDDRLADRLDAQHERQVEVAAQRGAIVDRRGRPLAISVELDSVYADPKLIEDPQATAELLAPILGRSAEELVPSLSRSNRFVWLARHVPEEVSDQVHALDLPGVRTAAEPHRHYPGGSLAAQILGFVGVDGKGLEGLEARFDNLLMGDAFHYRVLRDGRRRPVNADAVLGRHSTEGDSLVLTLDRPIQHRAEQSLAEAIEKYDAAGGMIVVLEPDTGAVLAMASLPSFDPNHFQGVPRALFRHLALGTVFEPGSTMKPFVVAEVLERNLAHRDESIYCEKGAYKVGRRTIHDSHPHEDLTVDEILKLSSNIGTTKLGERLGPAKLEAAFRKFGFGSKTGIDLSGEEAGILRSSASWSRIGMATHCFGQGMAVTAIQLASAMASLVNGGTKVKPHLAEQVLNLEGEVVSDRRPPPGERLVSEETSRALREMMAQVVQDDGTGPRARLEDYSSGGKTGTAQKVKDGRYAPGAYVSSFIGFAPVDHPAVLTYVVLDEPQGKYYGGTVAGPVFKDVTTFALRELGVAPDLSAPVPPGPALAAEEEPEPRPVPSLDLDVEEPVVPDLLGLSARDVVALLGAAGFPVKLEGSGLVASQNPAAGEPLLPGTAFELALATRGETARP